MCSWYAHGVYPTPPSPRIPQEVATAPDARPSLPRSGMSGAVLPGQQQQQQRVIMIGGYTEDAGRHRQPTNEAFDFDAAAERWVPLQAQPGPAPRASHALPPSALHVRGQCAAWRRPFYATDLLSYRPARGAGQAGGPGCCCCIPNCCNA